MFRLDHMKHLLIMRHGQAVVSGTSDADRKLTSLGEVQVRKQASVLRDCLPDVIISSPVRRAIQTADLIVDELGFSGKREIWRDLVPSGKPEAIVELLALTEGDNLMVISHQPLVSRLVHSLTGHDTPFQESQICLLAKGEMDILNVRKIYLPDA